jgi:hypothetical protein
MIIINEKQILANCLDGLLLAIESIEDIKDVDSDLMQWSEQISLLYDEILMRFEN